MGGGKCAGGGGEGGEGGSGRREEGVSGGGGLLVSSCNTQISRRRQAGRQKGLGFRFFISRGRQEFGGFFGELRPCQ